MAGFLELAIASVTFFVMWVVGLELKLTDLRSQSQQCKALITGTLAQLLVLPALTLLIISTTSPPTEIYIGMLLVSLCPGGAVSNYYTQLAGGDIAYSISLTIISTLSCLLTLPWLFNLLSSTFISAPQVIQLPFWPTVEQLLTLLITPLCIGMFCRKQREEFFHRSLPLFKACAALMLLILVTLIFFSRGAALTQYISAILQTTVLFTLGALFAGLLTGKLLRLQRKQILAIGIEFPSRNLAIATAISLSLLEQQNAVLFAASMFILQLPVFVLVISAALKFSRPSEG